MTGNDIIQDELVYASVSSNRNENNISSEGELLLFSRSRCPVIYDLKSKILRAILIGHSEEVNGQCFVKKASKHDSSSYVISTAHDNKAIIWRLDHETSSGSSMNQYELIYEIISPVSCAFTTRCSIVDQEEHFKTVLTTIDGTICVYYDDELIQIIPTKHCYFDAKLQLIAYNDEGHASDFLLVALAGSDNKLHIFNYNCDHKLDHLVDLSGFNDWIKCVDILTLASRPNELLLAAACQDSLIQVWLLKLTNLKLDETNHIRTKISSDFGEVDVRLHCTLETVLSGHEGFVHSICWFKKTGYDSSDTLQLVSCSSDKTVLIWSASKSKSNPGVSTIKKYEQSPVSDGVWKEFVRFGETGEANLPFLGVCLSEDETTLYAQSLRGAIHSWTRTSAPNEKSAWKPNETICGHFDSITDLAWEKTGAYLLSSSLDKTCRLHAIAQDNRWHELARPQVHGFEINCLASLDFLKFASGAEEKTIRTLEATKFFIKNFNALSKRGLSIQYNSESNSIEDLPTHAQLPALGLSNRGSHYPFDVIENLNESQANEQKQSAGDSANGKSTLSDNNTWQEVGDLVKYLAKIDHLESLPYEEILLQSTLWWENNKLFGHSNELHALACDSKGSFLASASKANRSDLASVIVWDTFKFRKVSIIEHHSLTVTRLQFSPNDKFLLSVSRDRTWCLSERNPGGQLRNAYKKLVGTIKSNAIHERIIWDCCWTYDSSHFLTVSRDKKAILWSVDELKSNIDAMKETPTDADGQQSTQCKPMNLNYVTLKQFETSITAVDSPSKEVVVKSDSTSYLFVLGFEDGSVELHLVGVHNSDKQTDLQWQLLKSISNLHQLSVRRLAFQPMQRHDENEETNDAAGIPLLASGGDDCMVRLTKFHIRQA